MARKRYIETHSNYTLRKVHQVTSKGTVFETDLMTITEPNGFAPGQVPIYGDSNFKLSIRRGRLQKLKHKTGSWLLNENCGDSTTVWTKACADAVTQESPSLYKIKLRPNYTDIGDFACFGSASELVRASLTDIIKKFPAELFLTQTQYEYYASDSAMTTTVLGGDDSANTWYIVNNPFSINVHSNVIPSTSLVPELRYFCKSFKKYTFINDLYPDAGETIVWGVKENKNPDGSKITCPQNGQWLREIYLGVCKLRYYYLNGEEILLHNYALTTAHIRPSESYLTEFYNGLNDFEYQLVNRFTNNTARFQTPKETETGIYTTIEKYQWPTTDGWNLDTTSNKYIRYANDLLSIGEFYDEYYSDNIVRSMTHEALKNFDWTHTKVTDEQEYTIQDPNPYRCESILRVYGREFDDLRRYARNIKSMNSVSYSDNNDLPDYFLRDALEMAGWEVKMPLSGDNTLVTDVIYPGTYYGYDLNDANAQFLRSLKLSSNAILNAKGTKRGIEMLLALFGYHSLDFFKKRTYLNESGETIQWDDLSESEQNSYRAKSYSFKEYVGLAKNSRNTTLVGYEDCDNIQVRRINAYKDNYHVPGDADYDLDAVELQGLPLKSIDLVKEDSAGTTELEYLVPWYDKNEKYNMYFQGKGGWGKTNIRKMDLATFGPLEMTSDSGYSVYDETQTYLHFSENLLSLLETPYVSLNNEDIYYVDDITGIESRYKNKTSYSGTYSHYFILKDEDYCNTLGYDSEGNTYGWLNIPEEEIASATSVDAKRILYLESIEGTTLGNNPHTGFGLYDNGEDYINHFRHIFSGSTFDNVSDTKISGYTNCGIAIDEIEDNIKCWYFTDINRIDDGMINLEENFLNPENFDKTGIEIQLSDDPNDVILDSSIQTLPVGKMFVEETDTLRDSSLIPYNPEGVGNGIKTNFIVKKDTTGMADYVATKITEDLADTNSLYPNNEYAFSIAYYPMSSDQNIKNKKFQFTLETGYTCELWVRRPLIASISANTEWFDGLSVYDDNTVLSGDIITAIQREAIYSTSAMTESGKTEWTDHNWCQLLEGVDYHWHIADSGATFMTLEMNYELNGIYKIVLDKPYSTDGIFDEAAANSILNLKNFEINFVPNVRLGYSQYNFINDVVLHYVKQLVPSTAILSYNVPDVQITTEQVDRSQVLRIMESDLGKNRIYYSQKKDNS